MWVEPIKDDPPLPWEQWEYPGRSSVGDLELHGRREGVFLLFAGLFVVAAALLPVWAERPAFELALWIPGLERSLDLVLPAGLLAFSLTFFCVDLICELYGRRRAQLLVVVGVLLTAAVAALMWATGSITAPIAAAFAARVLVSQLVNLQLFHWLRLATSGRQLWLRAVVPALLGQLLGAGAASLVLGADSLAEISAASLVGYEIAAVAAVAGAIPLILLARGLASFLRIRRLGPDAREPLGEDDRLRVTRPAW